MAVIDTPHAPPTPHPPPAGLGFLPTVELTDPLATWVRVQIELTVRIASWLTTRAWEADGSRSPVAWLQHHAGLHPRDGSRLVKRARLLRRLDALDHLSDGRLPLAHADVLVDAVRAEHRGLAAEHAGLLLGLAERLSHLDDYARAVNQWRQRADDRIARRQANERHQQRRLTATSTLFGDLYLEGRFAPDEASTILGALDAYTRRDPTGVLRTPTQRRADALVDALTAALEAPDSGDQTEPAPTDPARPGSPRRRPTRGAVEPLVIVDLGAVGDDELDPTAEISSDGAAIGHSTLHRLMCEHRIALQSGTSTRLALGRSQRLPSPALRAAVRARDRHCAFPYCREPHPRCHVHHLIPWHQGGPTDADNLTLLCRYHHRLVHEGGWQLQGTPGTPLTAINPTGHTLAEPRPPDPPPGGRRGDPSPAHLG